MKALRSFKALVLKTPVEVSQEDVDTSVSPDDSKESKEKLTSYFHAKNNVSFRKFPHLVELVANEGEI